MNWISKAIGWWRLLRGYCPMCNLDAPAIDTCPVCENYRGPWPPGPTTLAWWRRRWERYE